MTDKAAPLRTSDLPPFDRDLFGGEEPITGIGGGFVGGKGAGLARARRILEEAFPEGRFENVEVAVPSLAILGTDAFDAFLDRSDLGELVAAGLPDDRLANAFQRREFPVELIGDLRGLVENAKTPLAVRSSSLLEDATGEPFAGVYTTKMIPNHEPDADSRFRRLVEAVKVVWASTFFREAAGFREITGRRLDEEKMAVIVQEVVGLRHQDRFYPTISGVARSFNYYPSGPARPEQGVVDLALGLGKTIVDGERCWSYCPVHPDADPPLTVGELLKQTQTEFWAVNMGKPPAFDPIRETEYLVKAGLAEAELDGALTWVASTYDPRSDRIVMGIGRPGPRVLDFSPTVRMSDIPLNALVRRALAACEDAFGTGVEIEFALTIDPLRRRPPRFGFLQVRGIVVARDEVGVTGEELTGEDVLVASERILGHGELDTLTDVVYVRPDTFDKSKTRAVAAEIDAVNRALAAEGRSCVLVTFGRLGSSDPWLGVPVDWSQISRAKAIVEATLPEMDVELSQGSHFFHNLTSLKLLFLSVPHSGKHRIRWEALAEGETVAESEHVRHVRFATPLAIRVDGRAGRGVIRR